MIIIKPKKKIYEVFPIGSPKGALNSKRKPKFIGSLKFKKEGNKLSINKFIANYENEEKLYPPSQVLKFFKNQAIFLTEKDEELEEFLKSNDITPRFTKICKFCVNDGNITIINSKNMYKYHNQFICYDCALNTIKRELDMQKYNKKVFRNFKNLLDTTKDLEKVINVINHKFDPLKNSNLTLFDKIEIDKTNKIPEVDMDRLKIPNDFKKILIENGNKKLLPIQILAINKGLLKGENILAVSATGSGKTLIGELAGIPKALNREKFIFLTPLVALANQKYRDFKKKYEKLGLKVAIKVGKNRVKAKGELNFNNSSIKDADIIVGTYEGIDFLIRSGNYKDLEELGLILIDEIHTLDDIDRGIRLNGLIKRVKKLFPKTQTIALSATVKNPNFLANILDANLVEYSKRPVPIERHLIYTRNESEKRLIIRKLIVKEFNEVSSRGFKGQTIIFTNSRRKTHQLSNYLSNKGLNVKAYHAGLSYYKKERIEKDFDKGKIAAVVTTAALAAGVDFPASQVIFDTLLMGNSWISPNEFSQMTGRAGRPSYHDIGKVFLLPEVANSFDNESEELVALNLLESDVEKVHIDYTYEDTLEEVLADISSFTVKNLDELKNLYKDTNLPISLSEIIEELASKSLIKVHSSKFNVTVYGRAVSMSFLMIHEADFIKNSLNNKDYLKNLFNNGSNKLEINILNNLNDKKKINVDRLKTKYIAMELELIENAYLSPLIHSKLASSLKMNISSRLFSESTLDIISSGDTISKLDSKFQDALLNLQIDFLKCSCEEKPFCKCLQRGISEIIIEDRLKGLDPIDISDKLFKKYQIQIYPGDIFTWLDAYLRNLDAVKRIGNAFKMKNFKKEAEYLIKAIEKS
ncbi:MAG: DEAD/DEAH box helicase [Methanobacteriaceae archaeon]|jgi:helicase|nr:DEAD/DEAH box helicase [Methanobacteriaceae archaeon]